MKEKLKNCEFFSLFGNGVFLFVTGEECKPFFIFVPYPRIDKMADTAISESKTSSPLPYCATLQVSPPPAGTPCAGRKETV